MSTGGCVKLKTVTEIRQSSARGAFMAGRFDLVLNSLWDWEPVERLKQKSDVVSFTLFQDEGRSTVLRKRRRRMDRGSRKTRKGGTAEVET